MKNAQEVHVVGDAWLAANQRLQAKVSWIFVPVACRNVQQQRHAWCCELCSNVLQVQQCLKQKKIANAKGPKHAANLVEKRCQHQGLPKQFGEHACSSEWAGRAVVLAAAMAAPVVPSVPLASDHAPETSANDVQNVVNLKLLHSGPAICRDGDEVKTVRGLAIW